MRGLKRNERTLWYCLLDPTIEHAVLDEDGYETGEVIPHYNESVRMTANVSPAKGYAQTEMFGNLDSYDKVIVTCDTDCPIDENTVLFVDKEPEYTEITSHEIVEGETPGTEEIETVTYMEPKNDYIVKRVAKSLNSISIAISKVTVS